MVDRLRVLGFLASCFLVLCVSSTVHAYKEFLKYLGLIHMVPIKLTSKMVFLLYLVLMCLEFYWVSGPLGKMSFGGGRELDSDPGSVIY